MFQVQCRFWTEESKYPILGIFDKSVQHFELTIESKLHIFQFKMTVTCGSSRIRTYSVEAPDLQSVPTLQRWRTPIENMAGFDPAIRSFADFCLTILATCSFAEAEGIEPPKLLRPTVFKTASSNSRTTSTFSGEQRNRTFTSGMRTYLTGKRSKPISAYSPLVHLPRIELGTFTL